MFITPAYAQAAGAGGAGLGLIQILPFALIFVVFYFLMIRPQQKKMKAHREMLANLRRGDRIVTGGGIIGRIARVEDEHELIVEIAPETRVRLRRGTVSEVISRSEPAVGDGDGDGDGKSSGGKKRGGRKSAAKNDD